MTIGVDLSLKKIEDLLTEGHIILCKCHTSSQFDPVYLSSGCKSITGFESPSFYSYNHGDKWVTRIHRDDRERFNVCYREVFDTDKHTCTYRFKRKDGQYVWLWHLLIMERNEEGRPQYIYGLIQDVTRFISDNGIQNNDEELDSLKQETDRDNFDFENSELKEYSGQSISVRLRDWILKRSFELEDKIEHQKNIERKLRKRLLFEYALTNASVLLMNNLNEEAFNVALNILMEVTDCDRVYVSKNYVGRGGSLYVRRIYEVCREDAEPLIEDVRYRDMLYEDLPWWYENLSNDKIIYGSVDEIPSPEWEMLKSHQVQSIAVLPFYVDDEWNGLVGFEHLYRDREWEEEELTLLKSAADLIGAAIKRQEEEQAGMASELEPDSEWLEQLPAIFMVLDKKGRIQQHGRELSTLTGYPADQLAGQPLSEFMKESEEELINRFIESVIQKGRDQTELELYSKSGKELSLFIKARNIQVEGKSLILINGFEFSGSEIYAKGYRDAANHFRKLTGEIHHQVKNNLAILTSLFDLQKSDINDPDTLNMLSKSQARINTFALHHEYLYQAGGNEQITVKEHLTQLVKKISGMFEEREKHIELHLSIGDFTLPSEKALPLALLINEIVINSYEHAFKDQEEGSITVEIQRNKDRVWVRVADNGRGVESNQELTESQSLGMNLIRIYLKQLGAKWSVNVSYGVSYEIIFDTRK